ncbi:MAG: NAD-binding protein [Vulcanimicrobiota bacterium]
MKPILVICGAGQTGAVLAERAISHWRVTMIDIEPNRGEGLPDEVIFHPGDATSSLVLKKAEVDKAHFVVAATGDDEVNFEVCRMVRDRFEVANCLALVHQVGRRAQFEAIGARVVSRPRSVASIVESQLDAGRRTTSDIGLGQGEIYEVTVQPHSPVVGKSLAVLRPQSWILGAIYRKDRLVVPHGQTQIEAGDRCLLIGHPEILPGIADYFQRGTSEFPLQFGTTFGVLADSSGVPWEEVAWLVEHSAAREGRLLVPKELPGQWGASLADKAGFHEKVYPLDGRWPTNFQEVEEEIDNACLVVPAPEVDWRDRFGFGNRALMDILDETSEPVLIARGSHPYKRILLAVSPGAGTSRAAELAVDVTRKFSAQLTAVGVCPADIVGGEDFRQEVQEYLSQVRSIANLYNQEVKVQLVDGNPVHQLTSLAEEFDLLVVAHRRRRQFTLTRIDVSRHLMLRSPCSVMVLPFLKENVHGR